MASYKQLIGFVGRFIKRQKWIFAAILFIDLFAWPMETLLWPYILNLIVEIFTRYEGDRIAAWDALKTPMIAGVAWSFTLNSPPVRWDF